jgi:hypothetical protein
MDFSMTRQGSVLALFIAAACSRSDENRAESTKTVEPTPVAPPAKAAPELAAADSPFAEDFPGFDATAVAKKLQGTWVFAGNGDVPTVWAIEGTKVTRVKADGTSTSGALEITSPCVARMRLPDGGEPYGFVFEGDTLHLGLGTSGAIVGATTYVCAYPSLIRKTGETCEIVEGDESKGGKLAHIWAATSCTADASKFTTKDRFNNDVALQIAGTALFDDQMKQNVATKVADLEAGKAKLAELTKK